MSDQEFNPYQPPKKATGKLLANKIKTRQPTIGTWIGAIIIGMIAGLITFATTCFGAIMVFGDFFYNHGMLNMFFVVIGVTAILGIIVWAAACKSLIRHAREENRSDDKKVQKMKAQNDGK